MAGVPWPGKWRWGTADRREIPEGTLYQSTCGGSIKLVLFSNEPTHHHKLNSTVNNNNTFSKGAEVY
ncbi:hypothetical protein HYE67_009488 [Fusarium culmorum]